MIDSKLAKKTLRRAFPAAGLTVLLALAVGAALPAPDAGAQGTERRVLAFDRLNRSYEMDDSQMRPVQQGPVTIHLSSPRNSLVLRQHSVGLTPLGDGTHEAAIILDFLGSGDLVADVATDAGTSSRLDDLVIVPRQTIRLAGSLVTMCDQMGLFLGLDCDGLDRSLSRVEVPMPEAGSVFFLPEEELSEAEVRTLEAYLSGR